MPRLKSYWNGKANALMTPEQRLATDERYALWIRDRNQNSKMKWNAASVERARQWTKDHPEEARIRSATARATRKARRMADPEFAAHCKAKKKENRERAKNKPYFYRMKRKERLKKHGWTLERFDASLAEQSGCCAICRAPFVGIPDADHEHVEPPKPRGLLCGPCNKGIGHLRDNPAICEAAAAYLRKWA